MFLQYYWNLKKTYNKKYVVEIKNTNKKKSSKVQKNTFKLKFLDSNFNQ